MDTDVVSLLDARTNKQPDGSVKVSCLLEHAFDDDDLKDEIIRRLLMSPDVREAVKLIQDVCNATQESACKVCLEMANDLLVNTSKLVFPVEEEKEEENTGTPSSVDDALCQSLEKVRKRRDDRSRHFRHPIVSYKQYRYQRLYYFYADPKRIPEAGIRLSEANVMILP